MQVQNREICLYKSKLMFGMVFPMGGHRLNSRADLFSCENPPELYSCYHCCFETDLSIDWKRHAIGLHRNEETKEVEGYTLSTYDCERCKFQTFSLLVMLKHITDGCAETTESSISKRIRFECDQCLYATNHKSNLNRHKIHKHTSPGDIKWLECDRCEVKFKTTSLLRLHVKRKHDVEWFECAQCPYKTVIKDHLRRHTYIKHSDPSQIKWFECDRCPYRGKYRDGLKRHMTEIHSKCGEKARFACGQCSYVAKRKEQLSMHTINKHTSCAEMIKRYKCDQCPYTTNHKSNLNLHKLYKHTSPEDIKWLECDRCKLKFKSRNLLRQHVKKVHKIE